MLKRRFLVLLSSLILAGAFTVPAYAETEAPVDDPQDVPISEPASDPDEEGEGLSDGTGSGVDETEPAGGPVEGAAPVEPAEGEPTEGLVTAPAPLTAPAPEEAEEPSPYAELDARATAAKDVLADDTYYIGSSLNNMQVIDVAYGSTEPGGNVLVWEWNGDDNQKWEASHDETGYVSLRSVLSGLLLTVGGDTVGANVDQQADLSGDEARAQKWIVEFAPDGKSYTLTSALSANLVLDLAFNTSVNGTNAAVWTTNGGKNQSYAFVDATPVVAASTAAIEEGYYIIKSGASANAVDIAYGSASEGANALTWSANGDANQLFKVTKEDGYYRITAAHSDKSLDLVKNCPVPGVNVAQKGTETAPGTSLFAAYDNGDGTVSFVNLATGLTLSTAGTALGANLYGDSASDAPTQRFVLEAVKDLIDAGMYEIVPATNAGLRIDVAYASRESGANVTTWTANKAQNQKWDIQPVPGKDNTYTIQSVRSGIYLASVGVSAGDNVNQQDIEATDEAAQWVPAYVGGKFTFQNVASGLMLDMAACGSAAGTNVQLWTSNGSVAQRFSLTSTEPIPNGCFFIQFASDNARVLDVAYKSTQAGGNAISWANNNGANQKWFFQRQSDGTYKILNAFSELPLGLSGTNVQQVATNSNSGVKWNLVYNHDGTFSIVNASNSSVVLSLNTPAPADGSNAELAAYEGNGGQRFTFEPTSYTGGTLGLSGVKLDMYKRAQGYSSPTNYLILIDNRDCWVGVFRWADGRWNYDNYFRCTNGKDSTPSLRGTYYVGAKGYTFGSEDGHACYWYTQIYGDYLFHSTLYYPYSFNPLDPRLGMHLSNGCVRLHIDSAKYIYDKVPYNTKIVSYN